MLTRFPLATFAQGLPQGERDRFASIALRIKNPTRAIAAYKKQLRKRG